MTYICYQGNDRDCGFAALKMLLANKTKNKSYLYIRKSLKKKDFSFHDLIKIAKSYGVTLLAFEMPTEDVRSIPRESLVLLKGNHLVYLKRVTNKRIYYIDPYEGKKRVSLKQFESMWEGKIIECSDARSAEKLKIQKPRMTPIWMDVIHYLMVGVIFASLMAGFYLIQDTSSVILTMSFLALFAITELVENWYILKELKFFDDKFLIKYFSRRNNQNESKYRAYIDFKSNHFIVAKLLASNLVMISAFSILLCINDYRNIFVFLILLLIRMLDNLLFSKKDKEDVRRIENAEALAFDCDTTMYHELQVANDTAGKVALRGSIRKVIYLFISLCLAVLMMGFSNLTSTNFIIFHFGIYFIMSEAFDNLIRFFANRKERIRKRAMFLDDCDL